MPVIRVYEPALCCNTGVCGPDVDQALVDFTADLNHLADRGTDITRHNLANDPQAFAHDETVRTFLHVAGSEGLPLTTVDGVTVMTGTYPTREQLLRFAGLEAKKQRWCPRASPSSRTRPAPFRQPSLRPRSDRLLLSAGAEPGMRFLEDPPRFLFFTGKGGVGKTSVACAAAVTLVDARQPGPAGQHRPSL